MASGNYVNASGTDGCDSISRKELKLEEKFIPKVTFQELPELMCGGNVSGSCYQVSGEWREINGFNLIFGIGWS